jgi:hypothetical protein
MDDLKIMRRDFRSFDRDDGDRAGQDEKVGCFS